MKIVLVVLACFLALATAQRANPPDLRGRWRETKCNLIPNLDQTYQARFFEFERFNADIGGAGYREFTEGFKGDSCGFETRVFRLEKFGYYRQTGFLSDPARFWDIDFLQSKKVMEVYTEEYADYLNGPTFRDCNFEKDWKVGEPQDVTFVFCPRFTLVPADECPVNYNMVRKVGKNTIFFGDSYSGVDQSYVPACINSNRLTVYGQYSLTYAGRRPNRSQWHLVDFLTSNVEELEEEIESNANVSAAATVAANGFVLLFSIIAVAFLFV